MSKARIIADYAGTGATSDLATQAELDASETALGFQSVPHIVPDVLYPAIAGNDLDGTDIDTSHGSTYTYGTTHTDGRMYYYTDIKGSKPIKDPRIGAHFGSQRHKFRSLQILEQETATHGQKGVYSIDGREWCRMVNVASTESTLIENNDDGNGLKNNGQNQDGEFYEIIGYFNDINIINRCLNDADYRVKFALNGAAYGSALSSGPNTTAASPLVGRFVDSGSVINLSVGATLGINTVKINTGAEIYGIELIAQDTSSTANKSKIQIPAQNVVSYGKKFSIPATAQHYNPFDGMSGAKTLAQLADYIDTGTSLGMENWKGGTSNYHKPFNGGRVVKWIDSTGTIKTSVTMMPPNAQNIGGTASNAVSNAHIIDGTNDDTINFDTTTIANATPLSEVAKTFHWREFGNGSANGNATYADASMLNTQDDIAYVMDDGLTSLSAYQSAGGGGSATLKDRLSHGSGDYSYITFIGTGITFDGTVWADNAMTTHQVAQNLPYGTHILKVFNNSLDIEFHVDGIKVYDSTNGPGHTVADITFHQPKMPPIPQDAVVIADYMLMADFVPQTTQGHEKISKGSRLISASRDFFHDTANGTLAFEHGRQASSKNGLIVQYVNPGVNEVGPQLTWFGDAKMVNEAVQISDSTERSKHYFDGSTTDVTVTSDYTDSGAITTGLPSSSEAHYCVYGTKTSGVMGKQISKFVAHPDDTSNDWLYYASAQVATPIHTSHHYQTFETPFLRELVGGDRNMEQNNLIVTPDGKNWDEVTRDTSYLGNMVLNINADSGVVAENTVVIFDEILGFGTDASKLTHFYKDFAIAYDRQICLVDGQYVITYITQSAADSVDRASIFVNGVVLFEAYTNDASYWNTIGGSVNVHLKRGDYVQIKGGYLSNNNSAYSSYHIERV